jgi:hypothetical protein
MTRYFLIPLLAAASLCAIPAAAAAQAWTIDARSVGLGGIGGDANIAAQALAEHRGDRSIVLPLGLFQVWGERDVFKPKSQQFDPARAIEYVSNPLHLQFGRSKSSAAASFVHDIRNASLSRDLSAYSGFAPTSMTASGLVAPKYGPTFWFQPDDRSTRHGLFVGAGPHFSIRTNLATDPFFAQAFDERAGGPAPNQSFSMHNDTTAQAAMAITAGYRGRFAPPAEASLGRPNRAAFVSFNFNYLHGFRYEDVGLGLRMSTGGDGLLVANSAESPLAFTRLTSGTGRGMSVDLGFGISLGGFEMGFSGNNIGNRLNWRNLTARPYSLGSLFSGNSEFLRGPESQLSSLRVVAPVDYRGNLGFRSRVFSFQGEIARASDETAVQGGVELLLEWLQFRGAASRVRDEWVPSGGLSLGITRRFWLDLATFMTTANIERERRFALATSLRWRRGE